MAISDRLYELLAEAKSRPSRTYRTVKAALDIPERALQGYLSGSDIADKIRQRKMAQQSLFEALGGNVPSQISSYGSLPVETVVKLGGFKGLADVTEPIKTTERNDTLENILSEKVRNGTMTLEQASAIKRSMSPGTFQKPPPGFTFGPDGNSLVPMPGSDPALKRAEDERKRQGSIKNTLDTSKLVINKIDSALSSVGPTTTGVMGALTRKIPGTPAKNFEETLATVKANVGFETLQNMRQNSPTGGALGQISDKDIGLLTAVRGSLDQAQSSDQIVRNLAELRKHYSNATLAIENQTGDPEADDAIAQIISSDDPENKKIVLIRAVRARAGR